MAKVIPAKTERSETELIDAAGHVAYEWWMLWWAYRVRSLSGQRSGWELEPEWNAGIEVFLLHYRNLLDFLSPPKTADDDYILATDYVKDFAASKPPVKYRLPLNKHLSHLSYRRLVQHGWHLDTMTDELWESWQEFSEALNDAHPTRCDWFRGSWTDPRI